MPQDYKQQNVWTKARRLCMCLNEFKRILERGKKNNLLKSYFFTLLSYNVFYQMGLSLALCTSATIEKVIGGSSQQTPALLSAGVWLSACDVTHTTLRDAGKQRPPHCRACWSNHCKLIDKFFPEQSDLGVNSRLLCLCSNPPLEYPVTFN